jgi:hypothetical protein
VKQFGRQIRLYVGNGKTGFECSQLRISFEVTKTIGSEPNPAKIRVYNLNESKRNAIRNKEYNKVILWVGYSEMRVIYAGDIVKGNIRRDGLDIITEMECGDGANAIIYARVSKTLSAGASDTAIVNETLRDMDGISTGVSDIPNARILPRGKALVGNARDILSQVARNNKADWSVQDGSLLMLPKDKALEADEGFILSKDTGMIGSPEETGDGLKVTCLLNPALRIGSMVRVESILKHFNGDYKITELSHSGDYMADNWSTQITCIGGQFRKVKNK